MPVSRPTLVGRKAQTLAYVDLKAAFAGRLGNLIYTMSEQDSGDMTFPAEVAGALNEHPIREPVGSVELGLKLTQLFADVKRCFDYLYDRAGEGTPPVFKTNFTGDVATQQSLTDNIETFNAADSDLVTIIEGMGGEEGASMTWHITFTGMNDVVADNFNEDDTITLGDQTYTFKYPGMLPGESAADPSGELYTAPNQVQTRMELGIAEDSNSEIIGGNLNGLLNTLATFSYMPDNLATIISLFFCSADTEAPGDGYEMDPTAFGAWQAAVVGDPTQNSPWPPVVITFSSPVVCSVSTAQPIQIVPA